MGYSNIAEVKRKLSDDDIRKILQLRHLGMSMRELGRKFHVSHRSIGWRLYKNALDEHGNIIKIHRTVPGTKVLGTGKFDWEEFQRVPEEEKAYWAGFITADGSIYKNTLTVEISNKDAKHLEWWDKFDATVRKNKHRNSTYLRVTNPYFIAWLNTWGIYPQKTGKEIFPKNQPENLIKHWIRGLIDGDGYFTTNKSCVMGAICSASENFLQEIQTFLKSHHINTNLNSFYVKGKLPHYKLIYYQRMSFRLADLVNGDIKLDRKWNKILVARNNQRGMSDASIEKIFALRKQGLSLRSIAKEVGHSFSAIRYRLDKEVHHRL